MSQWVRRLRGVIGMGLVWAVGGIAIGGLIELVDNILPAAHAFTRQVDMWAPTLAILAFPRGVVFAIVLALAKRHRRFEDFSVAQFTTWGAVAGLALGLPALLTGAGIVYFLVTLGLSALAGASSLVLARVAERRGLLGPGSDVGGAPIARSGSRELLGRGD